MYLIWFSFILLIYYTFRELQAWNLCGSLGSSEVAPIPAGVWDGNHQVSYLVMSGFFSVWCVTTFSITNKSKGVKCPGVGRVSTPDRSRREAGTTFVSSDNKWKMHPHICDQICSLSVFTGILTVIDPKLMK